MPTSPAALVVRGLRADTAVLTRAVTGGEASPAARALLCTAGAELAELTVAHVRSVRRHVLGPLAPRAGARTAAELQHLELAADAVGDASTVLVSAGLSGHTRVTATAILAERVEDLRAALPPDGQRHAPEWDVAALRCEAPAWLVLGSALRGLDDTEVPEAWRLPWQQVRPDLTRSALHRLADRG